MALAVKRALVRVQATGYVLGQYPLYIGLQFFGIRMGSKGVQIGQHKKAGVFFLHTHKIAQGAKVITQVQKASGPDATHNNLLLITLFHKAAKIRSFWLLISVGW